MSVRNLVLLLNALVASFVSGAEPNYDHVAMGRFQLAAMKGIEGRAFADYKSDPNQGKQCVMIVLDSEFEGQFLFFANQMPPGHMELVCFEPHGGKAGEWTARIVKINGEIEKTFGRLRELAEEAIEVPLDDDLNPIHGDSDLRLVVGVGNDIADRKVSGASIAQNAKLADALSKCIQVGESMVGRKLARHIETLKNSSAEQGGARQPTTAPDSKSEGNEKPKPESEGRSQ